jgi:hypothetical protein
LAAAVRDRWPPVHIVITTGKFGRWKSRRTRYSQALCRRECCRGDENVRKYELERPEASGLRFREAVSVLIQFEFSGSREVHANIRPIGLRFSSTLQAPPFVMAPGWDVSGAAQR